MNSKIVYIMNVDWDWAKQRPHFLAKHLSLLHDMIVLYPFAWRRTHLVKNERDSMRLYPFFRLPFGGRFHFIARLNIFVSRIMASVFLNRHRPDIVWISSPELFEYLPKRLSARLIYDCMDDILAFPINASRRDLLAASETALVAASANVFCSSNNLRDKLISRAGHPGKYSVINNAFEPSAFSDISGNCETGERQRRYVLGYVGTISSWFDFDALILIVNTFPAVEIHLVGPVENLTSDIPLHERIKYIGAVQHADLPAYVCEFDALLMPFHVTELIQSVDPVKLYEYVFFNKPIVSVWYAEIERFSAFADLYVNHEEMISIIHCYLSVDYMKKYSTEQRLQFIACNTWFNRVVHIEEILSQ